MDSPRKDPRFLENDLNNVLKYSPRLSYAVWRASGDSSLSEYALEKDRDVFLWLQEIQRQQQTPGLAVILGARAAEGDDHNAAILEYLPFSREATEMISKELCLHGDIVRVINRSDMAFFEDINLARTPHKSVHYCCRTSGTWDDDLAICSSYNTLTGFTSALVLGCSDKVANDIAARIENSEDAWKHPLLIVGIMAEIERQRHLKLVDDSVFNLLQRVRALSNAGTISTTSNFVEEDDSLELWIKVSQLRTALKSWKKQLSKMDEHIGELEGEIGDRIAVLKAWAGRELEFGNMRTNPDESDVEFGEGMVHESSIFDGELPRYTQSYPATPQARDSPLVPPSQNDTLDWSVSTIREDIAAQSGHQTMPPPSEEMIEWNLCAVGAGKRIQKRLREIMAEYDDKVHECSMVIDGMILSTQLSYNQIGYQDTQANLRIASAARNDGKQMRSIAFLTMVFLPATFLASLFSMTFFNWSPSEGEPMVAPQIWIYVVLAVGVTVIVLLCWMAFTIACRRSVTDTGWRWNTAWMCNTVRSSSSSV